MDTKTMINQLKYEAEKHKNDSLFTGQTNITALCSDVIPKLEKLAEYETAEDEGRLVVLPCKVGDTVYLIDDIDCVFERESIVTGIEIDEDGVTIMIQDESPISSSGYDIQDFGETIFLNSDVAEKALEEMNQENATN